MRLFIILICALLVSCRWQNKTAAITKVNVVAPQEKLAPYSKNFIGIIKPVLQVTLRARVEGFLESRLFTEGGFVAKNQSLFLIDKKPYEAQLLAAKGGLEEAQANLVFQQAQYERYKKILAKQDISKAQYDQQYAQYLQAKGKLDSAQGNYDQALLNLSYCDVVAPMAGQVGKVYVDVGSLVSGVNKTELVKLIQLDPLRVEFNVSTADMQTFLRYKDNKPFLVKVSLPKFKAMSWQGEVDFYDNTINLGTSTLLLRTTIKNRELLLRPDLFVNVQVIFDLKHHFVFIPYELVTDLQGMRQVLVVDKQNLLQWRQLKLGKMHQDYVEVEDGIQPGDLIVLNQHVNLLAGSKVMPIKSAA